MTTLAIEKRLCSDILFGSSGPISTFMLAAKNSTVLCRSARERVEILAQKVKDFILKYDQEAFFENPVLNDWTEKTLERADLKWVKGEELTNTHLIQWIEAAYDAFEIDEQITAQFCNALCSFIVPAVQETLKNLHLELMEREEGDIVVIEDHTSTAQSILSNWEEAPTAMLGALSSFIPPEEPSHQSGDPSLPEGG